jgi:hypothetical protein
MNVDRDSTEDLVAASAFVKSVITEFHSLGMTPPDWVASKERTIRKNLEGRLEEDRKRELMEINQEIDRLATPAEKRQRLAARQRELQEKLGIEVKEPAAPAAP